MKTLQRVLRYEFKFTVRFVLAVVVIVVVSNLLWSNPPTWPFVIVGVALGVLDARLDRRASRTGGST